MEDIENFDNFDSWNNIKKDMHQNKNTFLAIPLTSKIKEDKQNSAILSQVKTIDAKRLAYKTGNLDRNVFENLEKSFVEFFDLTPLSRGGYNHNLIIII